MTRLLKAHFDGNHVVLDEPATLPISQRLTVVVDEESATIASSAAERSKAIHEFLSDPVRGAAVTDYSLRRERL